MTTKSTGPWPAPPPPPRAAEVKAKRAVAAFGVRVRHATGDGMITASLIQADPAASAATARLTGPGFSRDRDRVRSTVRDMDGVTAVRDGGPASIVLEIEVDYTAPVSLAAAAPPTPAMAEEIRVAARPDGPQGYLGVITGAHRATLRGLQTRGLITVEYRTNPYHPGAHAEQVGVLTDAGWATAIELDPDTFGELATTALSKVRHARSTRVVPARQAELLRAVGWIDGDDQDAQITDAGRQAFIDGIAAKIRK